MITNKVEYMKIWRANNKERVKFLKNKWNEQNPDKLFIMRKKWRDSERGKRLKIKWYLDNPDKTTNMRRKDYYLRNFKGNHNIVFFRDNFMCCMCQMNIYTHIMAFNKSLTIHHVDHNRSNNNPQNLRTLCLRCHGSIDGQRHGKVVSFP